MPDWLAGPLARTLVVMACLLVAAPQVTAQQAPGRQPAEPTPEERAQSLLAEPAAAADAAVPSSPPLLELFFKGGWLMAPIVLMSVLAAAVTLERLLGLRRSRVSPRSLERGLRQLAEVGDFEPRTAYRLCMASPSGLARVVTAMVGKAGRPLPEVSTAAGEAIQHEADKMYANVRTLNLTSAVTPLMGLLGTVGGMIVAFFQTQAMPLGSNKSNALAEGIYLALVTTFAGLAVAIPAAVMAHYLEGRIQRIARRFEWIIGDLLPHLERLEGGPRVDLSQVDRVEGPPIANPNGPDRADWPHPGPPAAHDGLAGDAARDLPSPNYPSRGATL
ncbi:MAG: MotA/TolQ/ExbB proton channel family protein [Planctomycetota bacterium]